MHGKEFLNESTKLLSYVSWEVELEENSLEASFTLADCEGEVTLDFTMTPCGSVFNASEVRRLRKKLDVLRRNVIFFEKAMEEAFAKILCYEEESEDDETGI